MTDKMNAPAADGKGEKHGSDYTADDAAIEKFFGEFQGALRQIGVDILQEGQADERAQYGRTLVYRTYGGTDYVSCFDVTDLRLADLPTFNALLEVVGYDK